MYPALGPSHARLRPSVPGCLPYLSLIATLGRAQFYSFSALLSKFLPLSKFASRIQSHAGPDRHRTFNHTLELLAGASVLTSHARAGLPSHGTEATSAAAKSILRGSDIDA